LQHYHGLKPPVTTIAARTAPPPSLLLLPAEGGRRSRQTSSTELGCSLSHLEAIAAAFRDGEELALILEDDALLSEQAFMMSNISSLRSLVASAPYDWNVLKLHTVNMKLQKTICKETAQAFVPVSWPRSADETADPLLDKIHPWNHWAQWGHWGTAAYVINRAGMEKALHATGYPNCTVWGRHQDRNNEKYTADEFVISPAVVGKVYTFARPLLSLMPVASGILHQGGADETFSQNTRHFFDEYLHGHIRCQPLKQ
jgi:GR25 family glycosyltransferase involved in LPS biosynthesis